MAVLFLIPPVEKLELALGGGIAVGQRPTAARRLTSHFPPKKIIRATTQNP